MFGKRKQFFVDPKLQGWVMITTSLVCVTTIMMFGVVTDTVYRAALQPWFDGAGGTVERAVLREIFEDNIYPDIDALFLIGIPLFMVLVMALSMFLTHKIAGPVVNIRRCIRQFADGDRAVRVRLRDGDYYTEVAAELNELFSRVERESTAAAPRVVPKADPAGKPVTANRNIS